MIIPEKTVQRDLTHLMNAVANEDSIVKHWGDDAVYGVIQKITNPKKGDLGEEIMKTWLERFGYKCEAVGRKRSRGGNNKDIKFDIDENRKDLVMEVKLSTLDASGKYQFNWIPVQYDYDFIAFIGINPNEVYLSIKRKDDIIGYIKNPTRGKTLTPVPPKNPTHRKWTVNSDNADMTLIETYDDIKSVFDKAFSEY